MKFLSEEKSETCVLGIDAFLHKTLSDLQLLLSYLSMLLCSNMLVSKENFPFCSFLCTMRSQVVHAVGGKVPVFLDGGVRRGTDIFKAVALGAQAVLVSS